MEHGTKVEIVLKDQVNLVGQDITKSVYSTISSLPQSTAVTITLDPWERNERNEHQQNVCSKKVNNSGGMTRSANYGKFVEIDT